MGGAHDISIPGRQVVHNRVDISPEAPAFKHKHPGEEIIYVPEGSLEYQLEGEPPTTLNAATSCSSRPKRSTR